MDDMAQPQQDTSIMEIDNQPLDHLSPRLDGVTKIPIHVAENDPAIDNVDIPIPLTLDNELVTNNEDVLLLLSALKVLRNQLSQVESDIKRLDELRSMAISDPRKFIKDFMEKKLGPIPKGQRIFACPEIDLAKYVNRSRRHRVEINYPPLFRPQLFRTTTDKPLYNPPQLDLDMLDRLASQPSPDHLKPAPSLTRTQSQPVKPRSFSPSSTLSAYVSNVPSTPKSYSVSKFKKPLKSSDRPGIGRSGENYRLWTVEEQYKLRALLKEFPESPQLSGMQYFEFLSKKMGSRTKVQLHSYVRHNRFTIPMNSQQDNDDMDSVTTLPFSATPSDKNDYDEFVRNSKTGKRGSTSKSKSRNDASLLHTPVKPLKPSKKDETVLLSLKNAQPVHHGYQCDMCLIEPIVGTRWRCKDCTGDSQVDLCSECVDLGFKTETHGSDHKLESIAEPEEWEESSAFNYLGF
ncbi:ZZ-type zinc finger-containing protein 3 [Batrachochytrium dendrobatidis]|nr:ZZ-type zinc finger-containing protein 3 [Batrachochytrium dendrobatidis]